MNPELYNALGLILTVAEVRRDQWDKAANEDFSDIVDELYEADIEERQDMAGLITEALRTVRGAMTDPTPEDEEIECATLALKKLDKKVAAKRAPYASYGWKITHDYITASLAADLGSVDFPELDDLPDEDAGLFGPKNISPEARVALDDGEGEVFRMADGDQIIYYKGLIVGDFTGFEPLDDFGTPNAGCTSLEIWNSTTCNWEVL